MFNSLLNLFRKKNKRIFLKNKGYNNVIEIDNDITYQVKINGNNNVVKIKYDEKIKSKKIRRNTRIRINIYGSNNTINIGEFNEYNNGCLNIDIGNYTGCDNVNIDIGKHLVVVNADIFAYQSGVPIKIGEDCLFSSGIVIRSGELPHIIYNIDTMQTLDDSEGIFIGNKVWLGQNVFVMKNVTVPNNTIIGSCAVVTKRFKEENTVIAGNPAKVCKNNIGWAKTKDFATGLIS